MAETVYSGVISNSVTLDIRLTYVLVPGNYKALCFTFLNSKEEESLHFSGA